MINNNQITVLGIGNTLYSDEGIGIHILPKLEEVLKDIANVEIVHGATDGMMLLGPIEETDNLIIVDAINSGASPGTIIQIEGDEIPKYFGIKMSIHQQGFAEVLAAAQLRERFPSQIVLIGMQPASLELGVELSQIGKETMPLLIERITMLINEWNDDFRHE